MGPVIIFDKSALQALSMDESVWLGAFFSANIVPLFYVETLADLEKDLGSGRSAEGLVGMLAAKTPTDAYPNVHHRALVIGDLLGNEVPMKGAALIVHGDPRVQPDGKRGVHVEVSAEADALARWREQEFSEVERLGARTWRAELASHDSSFVADSLAPIMAAEKISDLEQLKSFIDSFCSTDDPQVLSLLTQVLGVPRDAAADGVRRWEAAGRPQLDRFARYAVHVFKVDLLFYLGISRGFISAERASNRIDMAYLYYLPFTSVFASGDRLHARTAPLFMCGDQSFVDAQELKASFGELDSHYDQLPDEIKERGVLSFAAWPPSTMDNVVTQAWDEHMRPDWREVASRNEASLGEPVDPEAGRATVAELNEQLASAQPAPEGADAMEGGPDYVVIRRLVPTIKGRWRMVPPESEGSS